MFDQKQSQELIRKLELVQQRFEPALQLKLHSQSQGTREHPEDSAKHLARQAYQELVLQAANLGLRLCNLYFYHCKPEARNELIRITLQVYQDKLRQGW